MNALISSKHFSNYKLTSKQIDAVNLQVYEKFQIDAVNLQVYE